MKKLLLREIEDPGGLATGGAGKFPFRVSKVPGALSELHLWTYNQSEEGLVLAATLVRFHYDIGSITWSYGKPTGFDQNIYIPESELDE